MTTNDRRDDAYDQKGEFRFDTVPARDYTLEVAPIPSYSDTQSSNKSRPSEHRAHRHLMITGSSAGLLSRILSPGKSRRTLSTYGRTDVIRSLAV